MIPDEAVEAAAVAWVGEQVWQDCNEAWQADYLERARTILAAAAPHLMASKRESVTEWAAAHKANGNIYNYHRTREEAQAFVDSMAEVGAEMVLMTREVIPQTATEWQVAK